MGSDCRTALMVELADTLALEVSARSGVQVQLLLGAQYAIVVEQADTPASEVGAQLRA